MNSIFTTDNPFS